MALDDGVATIRKQFYSIIAVWRGQGKTGWERPRTHREIDGNGVVAVCRKHPRTYGETRG